ncbi:Uncharacterised protein [Mycobacterium tuberculosis]|nr:Uncharacterised protein [Mycobacterium tuberculosis]
MSCSTEAKNASMSRCSTQRDSTPVMLFGATELVFAMAINLSRCHRPWPTWIWATTP